MFSERRIGALSLMGIAMAVILAGCVRGDSYEFHGTEYVPPDSVSLANLTSQNNQAFDLNAYQDEVVVVYFGYTTCPDYCPATLNDFTLVKKELGQKKDKVNFVMITVDPDRDTPDRLKKYLSFFDPAFIGLHGSTENTAAAEQEFGVSAIKVDHPESDTGYLIDHSARVFVIDRDGKLRLTYSYGTAPADIAEDIQHLL